MSVRVPWYFDNQPGAVRCGTGTEHQVLLLRLLRDNLSVVQLSSLLLL